MIFKQWQQVLDGTKTQTRRVLKPGSAIQWQAEPGINGIISNTIQWQADPGVNGIIMNAFDWYANNLKFPGDVIATGTINKFTRRFRTRYRTGKRYAIETGYLTPDAGMMTITAIHIERLHDITPHDALCEGIQYAQMGLTDGYLPVGCWSDNTPPVDAFGILWDAIHGGTKYQWDNNPLVAVYTIAVLVEESESWK